MSNKDQERKKLLHDIDCLVDQYSSAQTFQQKKQICNELREAEAELSNIGTFL